MNDIAIKKEKGTRDFYTVGMGGRENVASSQHVGCLMIAGDAIQFRITDTSRQQTQYASHYKSIKRAFSLSMSPLDLFPLETPPLENMAWVFLFAIEITLSAASLFSKATFPPLEAGINTH